MTKESSPFLGVPSSTLVAVVVAAVSFFALNKLSFVDTRPRQPPVPIYWHSPDNMQDIEARLWEDPLAVVSRARAADPDHKMDNHHQADKVLSNHPANVKLLVVGVFVSGAPYDDAVEARRRARYAVLAGFHRSGFVPENAEHLGYFPLPSPIDATSTTSGQPVENKGAVAVYEILTSDDVNSDSGTPHAVVVLWLDQDAFKSSPIATFRRLVKSMVGAKDVKSVILGPSDSDGLRDMAEELRRPGAQCPGDACTSSPISIYSTNATAADDWVLNPAKASCNLRDEDPSAGNSAVLSDQFESASNHLVHLYRTVADDCAVSRALFQELRRRGIKNEGQITLIAERDSLYARLMGKYFNGCYTPTLVGSAPITSDTTGSGSHPTCFTYLRGLDGFVPAPGKSGDTADKSTNAAAGRTSLGTDASSPDLSTGSSQLDYLRRLGSQISSAMASGRDCGGRDLKDCTRVIGILGSDVYDKILILQAMRRSFPKAIFFTTDFDELLLDQPHLKWTRHLIMGAGFGPTLRSELQADVPPFRNTYQTSLFLGTLLAVSHELAENSAPLTTPWTAAPRVFEVGHTDAYDLTPPAAQDPCPSALTCTNIFPPPVEAFWGNTSRWFGLLLGMSVIAIGALALWAAIDVRPHPTMAELTPATPALPMSKNCQLALAVIVVAGLCLLTIFWPRIVRFGGAHHALVPVFGGVSLWGAVIVEVLTIATVACLAYRGQRKLGRNSEFIAHRFMFSTTPAGLIDVRAAQISDLTRMAKLKEHVMLPIRTVSPHRCDSGGVEGLVGIEYLLARYLYRGRWQARFTRVGIFTVLTILALIGIDWAIGTRLLQINVLSATISASAAAGIASFMSLLFMIFLVLWVVDAMLLSRAFILELTEGGCSWPANPTERALDMLGMHITPTILWLNLRLVALRTESVAGLVWYPCWVIAAMAIAAFTVEFGPLSFSNNPLSLVVSALLVMTAAILLRRSAEALRQRSLDELENYRSRALNAEDHTPGNQAQLTSLISRIQALDVGAFAPYSQQPFIRAYLVPAVTYGASLLIQRLGAVV